MSRRIISLVGGATAGLLTATFLPATVALADSGVGTAGNVGGTALPVELTSNVAGTGGPAALGDAGALGANVNAPTPNPLGELGALSPIPIASTPDATPGDDVAPVADHSFTIGDHTFDAVQDDGSDGFNPVSPLFSAPPFFQVGEGEQSFDVSSGTGDDATELGSVTASTNVTNLFGGIYGTQFTITDVDPADGATESDLPTEGTVYSVLNFGNGFSNVYTAIPGVDGADTDITNTLVTPFGDFDVPTDFDATGLLDPGDAFSGLSAVGTDVAGSAADAAAAGAADAAGSAADAAGGATDIASLLDPTAFFGI